MLSHFHEANYSRELADYIIYVVRAIDYWEVNALMQMPPSIIRLM